MKESTEGIYDKFLEEQKFKQLGVWIPLIIAALIVNGLFGYGIYKQIIQGQRFGNNPMSDTGLIISSIVFSILFLVIFLFFGFAKLKTEIDKEGIRIKFIPFHKSRLIDWNEIEIIFEKWKKYIDCGLVCWIL